MQGNAGKPGRELVLIADNDAQYRKQAWKALADFGYKVLAAEDGHAAFDLFAKTQPDVILLGADLPGLDGFDCCRTIRKSNDACDTPIFIIGDQEDEYTVDRSFKAGATDIIAKTLTDLPLASRIHNALKTSRSLKDLTELIRAIPDLIFIVNDKGEVKSGLSGPGATHTLQIKALTNASQINFYPCENDDGALECIQKALETGKPQVYEHTLRGLDIHLETRFVKRNSDSVLAIVRDITDRKDAEKKIFNLAYYDELTKLPNRELFAQRLKHMIAVSERLNKQFAVLFLDLDRFKRINDTLGHSIGDKLLKQVSVRLSKSIRANDSLALASSAQGMESSLARLGGDEFVICLHDVEGEDAAVRIADRIRDALTEPFNCDGHQFVVTPSIGISMYPRDGKTGEELLMNADSAMYRAKNHGRNNYKFFSETLRTKSLARLDMEDQLRAAIEQEQFELYFQPKVDAFKWQLVGAEALLRWHHPERGPIAPNEFIPVAEETGLIRPLGKWVLREACRQQKTWSASSAASVPVSVNISGLQFSDEGFLKDVFDSLALAEIDPGLLDIEITETVLMQDVAKTLAQLKALKTTGVTLSVDDFGTGYSSLSYLKRFPIDTVKIDRTFVKDLHVDADDAAICAAILAMARQLGLQVVAEGVETQEQLEFLRRHKCDQIQGFICSQALSADHFRLLVEEIHRVKTRRQLEAQVVA